MKFTLKQRKKIFRWLEAQKGDMSEYAMIALYVPGGVADMLKVPGGEPSEEMHITLAYLGEANNIKNPDKLRGIIAELAMNTPPLVGVINGVGRFIQTHKEGMNAVYVSPDLKLLPKFRERVCDLVRGQGVNLPSDHGFVPHITITYVAADKPTPKNILSYPIPVSFNAVSVVIGGDRRDFKLEGRPLDEVYQ